MTTVLKLFYKFAYKARFQSKVATARFKNVNPSNKNLFCMNIILSASYVSIWKLEVKIRRYSGEWTCACACGYADLYFRTKEVKAESKDFYLEIL